jgi:xylulokinase
MSPLFCGIDIGTTNLKVLLLDDEGKSRWVKSIPAPHRHDELGVVTDASALLTHVEDLIIEGWHAVAQGRVIAAISSAGIGEDGVGVVDHLSPMGHAIQWNDRRGEVYAAELAATDLARQYPAIVLDFSSSAGKWMWLRRHKPQELAGAASWITMTDWPLACWAQTPFISATLAPRTGCYDVFARQWIPDFLDFSSAPPMPPIIEAGGSVGRMQRGRLTDSGAATLDTLLVAGGHDHPVAASAIRRINQNARIDSMGTADATYGETTNLVPGQPLGGLYVTSPISGAPGAAVIGMVEFSVTLGKVIADLASLYKTLLSAKSIEDIPLLARPALDEMTLRTKHYWQAMTEVGVPQAPIYATGGWARSEALMQLRADAFGEPIIVVDEPELVALGAALFAAQGAGHSLSFSATQHSHVLHPR